MTTKNEEKRALETKLKGVMDFYVSTYFEHYSKQIKEEVAKHNMYVETDIMEARIDDRLSEVIEEAASKFHDVCMLVLDSVISGKEKEIRDFEVLFLDLLKRTLLKDMADNKRGLSPVIIIADQGAKEN